MIGINLKGDDELLNVYETKGYSDVFIASNTGYGLWYHVSEVKPTGQRLLELKQSN